MLFSKGDDLFQVFLINQQQSYKMDLLGEYNTSVTFNISNIYLFGISDDLRLNTNKKTGNDENQQAHQRIY